MDKFFRDTTPEIIIEKLNQSAKTMTQEQAINDLQYYGGDGFSGVKEEGIFEVKASQNKTFDKLSEARKYYDGLNEEKALWNAKTMELLETHFYKPFM